MPVLTWCWRCQMDIPMLDEDEWAQLAPRLAEAINDVQRYRERTGASLAEAREVALGESALALYAQITGLRETNVNALWHHRRSIYGPNCTECGTPLRTPRASYCVACGALAAAGAKPDA